ncbi:MAG: ABC transporter permease [Bacteroidales bacterium]|nr:ABC transporter permease [Bacteroidales bacterium]
MFRNYIKVIFRNFYRNKAYSIINIVGLSVGIATAILMLLFVDDELSYDKDIGNSENIYRVGETLYWSGKWMKTTGKHLNLPRIFLISFSINDMFTVMVNYPNGPE